MQNLHGRPTAVEPEGTDKAAEDHRLCGEGSFFPQEVSSLPIPRGLDTLWIVICLIQILFI